MIGGRSLPHTVSEIVSHFVRWLSRFFREFGNWTWRVFNRLVEVTPALAWPLAAIVILHLYFEPISRLLDRIQSSKINIYSFIQIELMGLPNELPNSRSSSKGGVLSKDKLAPLDQRASQHKEALDNLHILWVDDLHPQQNSELRRPLERYGARIDIANSNTEAIKWLRQVPYDIVITDLGRQNPGQKHKHKEESVPCYEMARTIEEYANPGCLLLDFIHQNCRETRPQVIVFTSVVRGSGIPIPSLAFGVTNSREELLHLIFDALARRPPKADGGLSNRTKRATCW
jgi:hypothetical protein